MLGKAISNFIRLKTYTTGTIAVASFLFFFSDFMLLLAWFSTLEGKWMDNLCMGTYYPGLCLLAFSIFMKDTLISDIK
jgi:hypothetical protein